MGEMKMEMAMPDLEQLSETTLTLLSEVLTALPRSIVDRFGARIS
jgi:hypothetical protein